MPRPRSFRPQPLMQQARRRVRFFQTTGRLPAGAGRPDSPSDKTRPDNKEH